MKPSIAFVAPLLLSAWQAHAAVYNFDLARNRGGVVLNASTDDSDLVFNTASPAGTSSMTWNVENTVGGNLSGATITVNDLDSSTGDASSYSLSIGDVNTDGYSDSSLSDGVWTSYMTTVAVNGSGPSVTLSGFSPGERVDLVLYTGQARWGSNNTGEFTFGGVTQSYAEAIQTGDMPLTEGETYLRFDDLQPDAGGEITGTFGALASGQEGLPTLSGLQFEVVPEPSAALLGAFGVLGLLRRRRR